MTSIVVSGDGADAQQAVELSRTTVNSFSTIVRIGGGAKSDWLRKRNELIGSLDESKTAIQLCENKTCRLLNGDELAKALNRI